MNSHNSAIASRTDFPRVASRTVTMQRCRNWAVVLYPFAYSSNASLPNLCMIFFGKPEVAVSQSLIIFCCLHLRIHLSLVSRISLLTGCDAMFAWGKLFVPIAYVYMSFLLRSIFLALNTSCTGLIKEKKLPTCRKMLWDLCIS